MLCCVKFVSFLCTFFLFGVCVHSFSPFVGYYNSLFRPLSADFKTKVETLGAMLKRHVQRLRATENKQIELVFLVDSSSSVGSEHFFDEVRFVRKLLADFTVDVNTTRVSVITFSSRGKVIRYVDHISHPSEEKHKCGLLHEELPKIRYIGGGTYTLGAFLEAKAVLRSARPDATKAIFLITDGFSNGGDPRPEARGLRESGVTIFTFGIRNGNFRELYDMASEPRNETCYILESFEEFEALARRALHEDLHSGIYVMQKRSRCDSICDDGNCCHARATCSCGTHTGKYECLCGPGYYGDGLGENGCKACPAGTYKDFTGPGNIEACSPCPDANQVSKPGTTSPKACTCKKGYGPQNSTNCSVFTCPPLEAPKNGYFVNNKCNNVFNAACGLRCRPGYELHGSSLRICQEDGTWSGQDTECIMKTCPPLSSPKNGHMICNHDDFAYSTVCRFTCNTGYKLVGSRKRTCLAIAFWTGITTRCREISCQPLGRLQDGSIHPAVCTAGEVPFGTTCQMSCHPGYELYGAHTKQCTPDGNWVPAEGKSNQCIDESPPFLQCPKDILITADEDDSETEVTWQVPVSVDNSALLPTLTAVPAITPPAKFPIGTTAVIYISEDFSKNKAKCKFYVRVIDQTPPRIDRCVSPSPVVSPDEHAIVTWEEPLFSDNSDDELKIESSHQPGLFPKGLTEVTYTAYDTSGNNNTCTLDIRVIPHPCEIPPPPANGNRTCFERGDSLVCVLSCLPDYDFAIPPAPEYTCEDDNVWKPKEKMPFPDCSVRNISNHLIQPATLTFTGKLSCRERSLLKKIDKKFEKKVSDRVSDLCEENVICGVEEIESTCEENNDFNKVSLVLGKRRRKRSTYRWNKQHSSKKSKNSIKLKYSFNLQASMSPTGNVEEDSRRQKLMMNNIKLILKTLQNETKMGTFNLNLEGLVVEFANVSFNSEGPRFVCEEGSILKDSKCVLCPFGTHFNVITKHCQSCPLGTYQPIEGALACMWCPVNQSTENVNTKQISQCKAQCLPGSYSVNGLEQCETCQIGFYQEEYAQTQCLPCPKNTTTRKRGSRTKEKCKKRCPPGYVSKSGLQPCLACPIGTYQSDEAKSACFECPGGAETEHAGSTALSDCKGDWDIQNDFPGFQQRGQQQIAVNPCFENPCMAGGTCIPKRIGFACKCAPGFGGFLCNKIIDECQTKPCLNNGSCTTIPNGYQCSCVPGFEGKKCEININECHSQPCQHNAVCIDGQNSFICRCPDGYQGATCDENIDECAPKPCRHGGTCVDEVNGFTCKCAEGFTGETCEIEIDECLENPCKNNGTCLDQEEGFRCHCETGYSGTVCETEINECLSNPCLNGAKCEDRVGKFICHCLPEFRGTTCEQTIDINYQLDFASPGTTDFAELTIDRPMTSVTVSFWMKTDDVKNYGTPFSYAAGLYDNALTLTDYNGFVLYVNQEKKHTDIEANDGRWHHIVITWSSSRGSWKIYLDGVINDSGFDLSTGRPISGGGTLVIGQEQDFQQNRFSSSESYIGSLSQLNIWDEELSLPVIESLRTSCSDFHGNVVAWTDILSGLKGNMKESSSSFCKDCPAPTKPTYGDVTFNSTRVGSFAIYSCRKGFAMDGYDRIQCLANGEYDEEPPLCERVDCGYPGSIKNGYLEGHVYTYDQTVNFQCYKGYKLAGSETLYCNEYGEWVGEMPSCREITCTLPLLSQNTRIKNAQSVYRPGAKVIFTCTPGNRLQTAYNSILCQADGTWDKIVPACDQTSCEDPPDLPNGSRETQLKKYTVSSIVTYKCNPGYTFSNTDISAKEQITCLPSGQWDNTPPPCQLVTCSDPPIIANGRVTGNERTYLSSVYYECDEGYVLSGDDVRECFEAGTWSGSAPECLPVECPRPADINHGEYNGDSFTFNSAVVYECDAGYKLVGDSRRQCQADLSWSGGDPVCKPVVCGNPPDIENGRVLAPEIIYTSIARYSCDEGYILEGPSERNCLEDGSWSTVVHFCHPVECKPPGDIQNGSFQSSSGYTYGNVVTYTCNVGYTLEGESDLTCQSDGTWSFEVPRCNIITCRPVEHIRNGFANILGLEYNNRVEYSCKAGYELEGHEVRTCQADRTWTDEEPHCVPLRCDAPESVANGNIDYKDLTLGSIVRYLCDAGYQLNGTEIRRCLENRTWSGEEPKCDPVTCPELEPPDNGGINSTENIFKTVVRYFCDEGYKIDGENLTTCTSSKTWSQSPPVCNPVECNKPSDIISNGRMNGTSFTFGSTISYSCDEGYRLEGSETRFCQANAKWDMPIPVCEAVECPRAYILNGFVSSFKREYNSVVTFSCKTGYYLQGSSHRICLASGKWNGTAPICKKIVCPAPPFLEGGRIKVSRNGLTASYVCHHGYKLIGVSERTCQVNGTWSHENPECMQITCPDLSTKTLPNGVISVSGVTLNSHAIYQCNDGYNLVGDSQRTCTSNSTWTGADPYCEILSCGIPGAFPNGVIDGSVYTFGSQLTYSCNTGYRLIGESIRMCEDNGLWYPANPRCQLIDCPPLINIPNGRTIELSNTYLGTVKYSCDAGYVLQGNMTRTCLVTGEWSGTAPRCIMKTCPTPQPIANGRITGNSYGLGRFIEYHCDEGYEITGSAQRMCLPTLSWSGSIPSCIKIECPEPAAPEHGRIIGTSFRFGDIITYECEEGYELVGTQEAICESYKAWSSAVPSCDPVSCGTPNEIPNGQMNMLEGVTYGSTVLLECIPGYRAVGDKSISCQKDGTWTETSFMCEIVSCPEIETFDHGTFQGGFNFGDQLNFHCDEGYEMIGEPVSHCGPDGLWDSHFPVCNIVSCPSLEIVQHGSISSTNYTYGSSVIYTCDEGFHLLGEATRKCKADATWSGQKPICQIVSCPDPATNIQNGRLLFPLRKYEYSSEAVYECKEGYNMLGNERLRCLSTGNWSSVTPTCIKIVCPPAEFILHGSITGDDEIIRYSCDEGYDLIGNSKRRCLKTGVWDSPAPHCMPIQCPDPSPVNHGTVHGDDITFGHIIRYSCLEGYELKGPSARTCQADRTWTDNDPTCNRIECGPPPTLPNGTVIGESHLYEDTITYICNTGFELVGPSTKKCLADRTWSESIPTCKQLFCNPPPTIANGKFSALNSGNLAVGTEVVYECDVGYQLRGSTTSQCLPDRTWSGVIPNCLVVSCPPLTFQENGDVTGNVYTYKSILRFSCARGYELFGDETLQCQDDGTWNSAPPVCLPRPCEQPPFFDNGDFFAINRENGTQAEKELYDYSYGDRIKYFCFEGYTASGSLESECDYVGRWSNPPPTCNPVLCGPPPHVNNAGIIGTSYSFRDSVYYVCDHGLELVGNNVLVCGPNGTWLGQLPECIQLECPEPPMVYHATVTVTSSGFNKIATFFCNPGYTLTGENRAICELGKWTNDVSTECLPVDCGLPPEVENGSLDFYNTSFEAVARVSCNVGYELWGPEEIRCDESARWSGGQPICRIINCGNPQSSVSFIGSDFSYGATLQYECPVGFRMTGDTVTVCEATGLWSNPPPECHKISCGRPNALAPFTGSNFTYGSTVKYYCEEGFRLVGEETATCQEDGTWSVQNSFCEIISCGQPPANVSFTGDNFYYGHTIQYVCALGFELIGEAIIVCGSDGRWSSDGSQYCRKINCGEPASTIPFIGKDFTYGSTIRFECPDGFKLNGTEETTCLHDGQWSSSLPECLKIDCGPPPDTASFEGQDFTYGKTVSYSCPLGHKLQGNAELMCQENGLWSGPGPTCQRVNCGPPPATASFTGLDFSFGGSVTYSCPAGHYLMGQPILFCQADKTWSDSGPICQRVSCGPISIPQNAIVIHGNPLSETHYRDTVTITCDEGFILEGHSSVTCLESGSWNASFTKCIIDLQSFCDLAVDTPHSKPIPSGFHVGDSTDVICDQGYEPEGNMTTYCLEGGSWTKPSGSCRRVADFCAQHVEIANSEKIPAGFLRGDVKEIQCETGYRPQGEMTSVCQDDGTWTVPRGYCKKVFCGKPMVRDMVNIMLIGRSFYYGDRIMYMCRPGMSPLHDPPQLICKANGEWEGEAACAVHCRQPCLNGGICLGLNRCKCPSGYGGKRCEIGICILPCLNGGLCEGPYKCKCRPGYTGPRCGRAICSKPCQNGGLCLRPDWCHCYGGFIPPFCETKQL